MIIIIVIIIVIRAVVFFIRKYGVISSITVVMYASPV